ncbi:MAG: hypothetical protein WA854_01090 [Candidatus Binataceae bacterium]
MERFVLIVAIVASVVIHPPSVWPQETKLDELQAVSLPQFAIAQDERVVKFECVITGGAIESMKVPFWYLTIDNGSGQTAKVTANITVGAGALTQEDLGFFHDFITISKPPKTSPYAPPFDMTISIWISTDRAMTTFRRLKFSRKDLVMISKLPSDPR